MLKYVLVALLLLALCGAAFGGAAPGWPPPSYVIAHQWQNVKDYGAKGDGTTDDLAAFQAAATAAGDKGTIFVPDGTFILSDTLTLNDSIILCGVGVASVIKAASGHNKNIITITGKTGVVIRDLMIDGNKANNSGPQTAIIFQNCTDLRVSNVKIVDMYGQGIGVGSEGFSSQGGIIENCIITGGTDNNIDLNGSSRIIVRDNRIVGTGGKQGIFVGHLGTRDHLITGNDIRNCDHGIDIAYGSKYIRVIGNVVVNNIGNGINGRGSQHCIIANNECIANGRTWGSGIYFDSGDGGRPASYNIIIGNKCYDSTTVKLQRYGLLIEGAADSNLIMGNMFDGNATGNYSVIGSYNMLLQKYSGSSRFYMNQPLLVEGEITSLGGSVHSQHSVFINTLPFSDYGYLYFYEAGSDGGAYIRFDTLNNYFNSSHGLKIGSGPVFPTTDGAAGYVLETDGSGVLSWQPNDTSGTPQIDSFYIFFTDSASAANGNRHINGILLTGDTLYVDTTDNTDSYWASRDSTTIVYVNDSTGDTIVFVQDTVGFRGLRVSGVILDTMTVNNWIEVPALYGDEVGDYKIRIFDTVVFSSSQVRPSYSPNQTYYPDSVFITLNQVEKIAGDSGGGGGAGGWTDDGNHVRLTAVNDSVGIGTATPTKKFHVVGPSFFNGSVTFGGTIDMDGYYVQSCGQLAMAGNGTVDGKDVSTLTDIGQTVGTSEIENGAVTDAKIDSLDPDKLEQDGANTGEGLFWNGSAWQPDSTDWDYIKDMPAGFADGIDNTGGGTGDSTYVVTFNAGTYPLIKWLNDSTFIAVDSIHKDTLVFMDSAGVWLIDGYPMGAYQPLEATLTDIADGAINEALTFSGNMVNTANPWADNEIADDITASNYELVFADSGTWNILPKGIAKSGLIIGNASDTGVADSNAATRGFVTGQGYITDSKLSDSSITLLNATAWRLFYSSATPTAIQELEFGADGTYLKSNGVSSAPTWASVPSGWNWVDSAGRGPDSVIHADSAQHADSADIAADAHTAHNDKDGDSIDVSAYVTTESDPVYIADPAFGITAADTVGWNKGKDSGLVAWNWADHSVQGYISSLSELYAYFDRTYFDTLPNDSIICVYSDSTDLSIFDTDDLAEGTNKYETFDSSAAKIRAKTISKATPTDNYIMKYDAALDSIMWEIDVSGGGGLSYWTEADDNDTSVFTATGPNTTVGLNDNLTMQGNDITGVANLTVVTGITVPDNSISDEELDEGATFTWTGAHNHSVAITTSSTFDTVDVGALAGKVHKEDIKYFMFNLADPDALYATDHEWSIDPRTAQAITIDSFTVSLNADPTTELEFSLRFADTFIGFANATVIDDTMTVAGVTTVTGGFVDATVPAGKCIYWLFDADPDDNITQASVKIYYSID